MPSLGKKLRFLKGRYLALIVTQSPRALYKERKKNQRIIILLYKREKKKIYIYIYPALKEESLELLGPRAIPQVTDSEGRRLQLFSDSSQVKERTRAPF